MNLATYQGDEKKEDNQQDNQRTARGHIQEGKECEELETAAQVTLFSCELFSIPESYLRKLQREYAGVDRNQVLKLCSKIEDHCSDQPNRYKRDKHGRLKNPKNVLRNWLQRELRMNQEPRGRAYEPYKDDL